MDAVTYPNKELCEFIHQNVIPLRIASDQQSMSNEFNVRWTPVLLILDKEGKEHYRTVGFFSPEELIPSLGLGIGHQYSNNGKFNEAINFYESLLDGFPESDAAPEAVFQKGVALYKRDNDPKPLKYAYEYLQNNYPKSEWTRRAYPYRLI